MREISLDRLRTLVAIADLGSFAEAARVLNLAPPTVSLHIADLESRVGARLLSRSRGRVQPSAIGATLVERARRLLADAQQALEDLLPYVANDTGLVGYLVARAALARTESRGAHTRTDFAGQVEARHTLLSLADLPELAEREAVPA